MPAKPVSGRYFGPEALRFLQELQRNNNRPWFQANKARYEAAIQEPAVRFVAELGPRLSEISPHVVADPRPFGGSLSRIYRDTRFSKDKSPYRTTIGIHFGHDRAEHGESLPGFYLHLAPGECFVASGVWRPEPQALGKIRQRIATAPAAWAKVLAAGIRLEGESYTRVPRGYGPDQRYAEDLRRKDFITSLPLTDSTVSGPHFGASFLRACRKVDPLNRFLAVAIGVPW